ncbi:hypothetical protein [Candidatus Chlamydia corallus]|uniref:hypothetical protein n=1 Tax=Candidatus Chlamydia corallus TaxID=2038470 RepID=UPI000C2FC00A|nr:hypothetical protein [Candidatus Chlamydia corallus]
MADSMLSSPAYSGPSWILKTSVAQEVFKEHNKAIHVLLVASVILFTGLGTCALIFPEYLIIFVLITALLMLTISLVLFFLICGLRSSMSDRLWCSEKGYALNQDENGPFLDVKFVRQILQTSPYIKSRALWTKDIPEDPSQAAVMLLSPWTFFSSVDLGALLPSPQEKEGRYIDPVFSKFSKIERVSLVVFLGVFTLEDLNQSNINPIMNDLQFLSFINKKAREHGVKDLKQEIMSWLMKTNSQLEPEISFKVSQAMFSVYRYLKRGDLPSSELKYLHLLSCFKGDLAYYLASFENPQDLADPEFLDLCREVEWGQFIEACEAALLKNPKGISVNNLKQFLVR